MTENLSSRNLVPSAGEKPAVPPEKEIAGWSNSEVVTIRG